MHIESVKRWQWLILGVIVGLVMGYVRSWQAADLPAYGEGINEQQVFERRVLSRAGTSPLFKDIRVSRQTLDDGAGSSETLYLVSGMSVGEDAKAGDTYQKMWYAAHIPYRPTLDVTTAGAKAAARWNAIAQPTVVDWLQLAHETNGVEFTNAWWDSYPIGAYTVAGVVLIGIIWPCLIDLYYFGRLVRPREAKGVSLRDVHVPTPAPAGNSAEFSDADLAHLRELESELEASMRGDAPAAPAGASVPQVRALGTDSAIAPIDQHPDNRHFRAKPEDFYPTVDRGHPTH